MKKRFTQKPLFYLCLLLLFAESCRKLDQISETQNATLSSKAKTAVPEQSGAARFDSYAVQSWYDLMLKLVLETPGHTPPVAARSFAHAGVALYEAVLGGTRQHHSLAGQLNGLTTLPQRKYGNAYSVPLTANAALARITKKLFQNASAANRQKIEALETANEKMYAATSSEVILHRSKEYGYRIADAVFNWSTTDGGHEGYLNNFPAGYVSPAGEDKWIPTPPGFQPAMLPYWGANRAMVAANSAGSIDPPAPPVFSTTSNSLLYQSAYEVYQTTMNLSTEQRTIALYWNDGAGSFTPPGHNIAIALQLIRNLHLNLSQAAILLAKVGIALNDAAIVCWRAKYQYNLLRPLTFINRYIDGSWTPLITTPPFPSYASGHATFSGATASILTSEIGPAVSFTDSTKMVDGFTPRSFGNFSAYAEEAAVSRLYGGIHYGFDNANGFRCGQSVAKNVEQLQW